MGNLLICMCRHCPLDFLGYRAVGTAVTPQGHGADEAQLAGLDGKTCGMWARALMRGRGSWQLPDRLDPLSSFSRAPAAGPLGKGKKRSSEGGEGGLIEGRGLNELCARGGQSGRRLSSSLSLSLAVPLSLYLLSSKSQNVDRPRPFAMEDPVDVDLGSSH